MKLLRKYSLIIYLIIQSVIFLLLLYFGYNIDFNILWASLIINLIIVILFYNRHSNNLLSLAILATAIGDIFLTTEWGYNQLFGLAVFFIVILLYSLFIESIIHLKYINLLRLLSLLFLLLLMKYNLDTTLAFIYIFNFIFSLIAVFIHCKSFDRKFIFGLLLFVFCDIFVGIYVFLFSLEIDFYLFEIIYFPWVAYLPAQLLLTLHCIEYKNKI